METPSPFLEKVKSVLQNTYIGQLIYIPFFIGMVLLAIGAGLEKTLINISVPNANLYAALVKLF
ncbi:MAG: hypothetical protein N2D54_13245, partial [Chloroflexota bacterium]